MRRNRRAKIVATVGPASGSPDMLEALFLAGVDTFRLNFSHGTHEDHAKVHAAIRALELKVGASDRHPAGSAGTENSGRNHQGRQDRHLSPETMCVLSSPGADGDKMSIPLPHPEIFDAVAPGDDLLIDDGRVRVRVTGRRSRVHRCQNRHRRRHLEPQGRQCAECGSEFVAAHGEGPGRSRLRSGTWASIGWRCRSFRNPAMSSRLAG